MGASDLLHPLTEDLKGKPLTLIWNLEMNQFFAPSKSVLANVHPDPSAQMFLSVDASGSHVGAVLQQAVAGSSGVLLQEVICPRNQILRL